MGDLKALVLTSRPSIMVSATMMRGRDAATGST
jgi:hypothetical protein